MKKLVLLIFVFISVKVCNAQTFDEWFKQNKTQRKYLIQQIAAFKVYIGYVQKGYSIAKKGLTTIGSIKNGDLNLHNEFFSSLKNVNPGIMKYSKVADIIAYQIKIIHTYKAVYSQAQAISLF